MARMTVGPTLDQLKARAEDAVNNLAAAAHMRRAFYAHKVAEARRVLNGESSPLLEAEAGMRGNNVQDVAEAVIQASQVDEAAELARVQTILAIRAAASIPDVRAILAPLKIEV